MGKARNKLLRMSSKRLSGGDGDADGPTPPGRCKVIRGTSDNPPGRLGDGAHERGPAACPELGIRHPQRTDLAREGRVGL